MGIDGAGPSPQEMGLTDKDTRIQNPELAREMADSEIEPREKLEVAAKLGLGDESIKELGLEVDQASDEQGKYYGEAMKDADRYLTTLLKNPNSSIEVDINGKDPKYIKALGNAINSRIAVTNGEGTTGPKGFTIGGKAKTISFESYGSNQNAFLSFRDINI